MTKRGYSLTLVAAIAAIGLLAGGGLRAAEPSGESNSTIKPSPVNFHGRSRFLKNSRRARHYERVVAEFVLTSTSYCPS